MGLTLLAAEKRKAARMALELPVVIRFQDGQDEVVETQNVSTDGLCFISERFIKPEFVNWHALPYSKCCIFIGLRRENLTSRKLKRCTANL